MSLSYTRGISKAKHPRFVNSERRRLSTLPVEDREDLTPEENAARKKALDDLERLKAMKDWDWSKAFEGGKDDIDDLIDEYCFVTMIDNGELFHYDDEKGIFVGNAEHILEKRLEKDYGRDGGLNNRKVADYIGHVKRRTYTNRSAFNPSIEWIATKNSMVNLLTGKTAEFDPYFLCTTQIPVAYEPYPILDFFCSIEGVNSDYVYCPEIMHFLNEIMSSSDVEIVLDFLAYCLWREYRHNLWMLFNGAGQNGKTTLLNLIEALFGRMNVSGESLERLLTERFAPANLYQKMVNVDADLSGDILSRHTGKLKKLTGNDEFPAEYKHKTPFKFRNYAKLIFSCNTIPEITDTTDAMFRRLIIINFTRQFLGDKEDVNKLDKLTTDKELSGLFHILVNRLPPVVENGIRRTTSDVMETTYDKYMRGADPVRYFVDKVLENDSTLKTKKMEMYESYEEFCNSNGLALESDQSFSRKLSKDFGYKYKMYREKNGERNYYWIGVKVTDMESKEQDAQDTLEYSEVTKEELR